MSIFFLSLQTFIIIIIFLTEIRTTNATDTTTHYFIQYDGHCVEGIDDAATCEEAANALGYEYSEGRNPYGSSRPEGCFFYHDGQAEDTVIFNMGDDGGACDVYDSAACVCMGASAGDDIHSFEPVKSPTLTPNRMSSEIPSKEPTHTPTISPTTTDTMTLAVSVVVMATAEPTEEDVETVRASISSLLGVERHDIHELTIISSSASEDVDDVDDAFETRTIRSVGHARDLWRRVEAQVRWDVSFQVRASLAAEGAADATDFEEYVEGIVSTELVPDLEERGVAVYGEVTVDVEAVQRGGNDDVDGRSKNHGDGGFTVASLNATIGGLLGAGILILIVVAARRWHFKLNRAFEQHGTTTDMYSSRSSQWMDTDSSVDVNNIQGHHDIIDVEGLEMDTLRFDRSYHSSDRNYASNARNDDLQQVDIDSQGPSADDDGIDGKLVAERTAAEAEPIRDSAVSEQHLEQFMKQRIVLGS